VWRLKQSLGSTWQKRPDLLKKIKLTDEQQTLLQQFISENETVS
jgi:tRNA (guanine37-N1)-methyltransferase